MKITRCKGTSQRSGNCRLKIDGEMTIYNAQALKDELCTYLDGYCDIEVDLCGVTELDAAGVQVLLLLHRDAHRAGKRFMVNNSSEVTAEVLELLDITQTLCRRAA